MNNKSIKNIIGSVISVSVGIIFFVLVVMLLFFVGKKSFSFGQAVFDERAVSGGLGKNVLVDIDKNMTDRDVAKYMKAKGLVEDENVFFVQIILSDYKNKYVAGSYMLNTNMKPTEILQKICSGEFYVDPDAQPQQPEGGDASSGENENTPSEGGNQ